MAERRMFTKKITDGDLFTAMPPTTQCLYFHLCMGADDDGFSNNVRIAMFNAHATTDDYNTLVQKRFIIPFDSGVIVIKHWRMHNYIAKDRYHETKFVEEKAQLQEKDNGVYSLDTTCIQDVYKMYPEVRLGKDSIEEVKKGNNNIYSREENIPFSEIIDYLNRVCGTSYRPTTKKTQDCIKARWNEGFRVDDFKKVIDNKAAEWLTDSKFCKYLRPETLFSNKFEGYLNQGNIKPVTRGGIEIDNGFRQGLDAEIVHFNVGG